MAYITFAQARMWSRQVWSNRAAAESELRKSASASIRERFDIFMSHSFSDAEAILGIRRRLEGSGLKVYVDWIEDAQLNRTQVTAETASTLRRRMKNCEFLLFATSESSPTSRWMPWELGYFDGLHDSSRIGILPVVESTEDAFDGQEYLGLYPSYELIDFEILGKQIGRMTGVSKGVTLAREVREARL